MPSPPLPLRPDADPQAPDSQWQRLVDLMVHPVTVGGLWIVAAVICIAAVATDPMSLWWPEQWTEPHSNPRMARGLAVVSVLGILGLAGLVANRLLGEARSPGPGGRNRSGWLRFAAIAVAAAGLTIVAGYWLTSHQQTPAGRLVLPLNQTAESVEVQQGEYGVDVMLPMQTTARFLDLESGQPEVWIEFGEAGRQGPAPSAESLSSLTPGESLDVEGTRFAFTGLSDARRRPRALISSPDDETVPTAAMPGDTIQLTVDGPEFRVVDVVRDYYPVFLPALRMDSEPGQIVGLAQGYPIGSIGPAVQLATENGDNFWIFERHGEVIDESDHVGENLVVDGVQMVPSPVFTVTPARPFWPFGAGLALFALGWALFFGFSNPGPKRSTGADGLKGSHWLANALGIVSVVALAAALVFGATASGVALLAGVAAVAGLPVAVRGERPGMATLVAVAIPVGTVVGSLIAFGAPWFDPVSDTERILWTAMCASWLAMGTALVGAGIIAERRVADGSTGGALTVAVAIWSMMGAAVTFGLQRGDPTEAGMGLPVVAEEGEAVWAIPDVMAASALEIPVVADGSAIASVAAAVVVLSAVAAVGMFLGRRKVALFGWIGTLASSVVGLLHLAGLGAEGDLSESLDAESYRALAEGRLEGTDLPPWIAEMGDFQFQGGLQLDMQALAPEIAGFAIAAVLAGAMIATVVRRRFRDGRSDRRDADRGTSGVVSGLMVRAVMFGAMGWVLGLLTSWERLGMAGILAPMEWIGFGAVAAALGLTIIGWRGGRSATARFVRLYGPAIAVGALVWAVAVGAVAGVVPGASISML